METLLHDGTKDKGYSSRLLIWDICVTSRAFTAHARRTSWECWKISSLCGERSRIFRYVSFIRDLQPHLVDLDIEVSVCVSESFKRLPKSLRQISFLSFRSCFNKVLTRWYDFVDAQGGEERMKFESIPLLRVLL